MKVQPISNSYRNINTNRKDINFGWFGGPMEPISTTPKYSIKKSVLYAKIYAKSFIEDVKFLNKNFWNFLLKK